LTHWCFLAYTASVCCLPPACLLPPPDYASPRSCASDPYISNPSRILSSPQFLGFRCRRPRSAKVPCRSLYYFVDHNLSKQVSSPMATSSKVVAAGSSSSNMTSGETVPLLNSSKPRKSNDKAFYRARPLWYVLTAIMARVPVHATDRINNLIIFL